MPKITWKINLKPCSDNTQNDVRHWCAIHMPFSETISNCSVQFKCPSKSRQCASEPAYQGVNNRCKSLLKENYINVTLHSFRAKIPEDVCVWVYHGCEGLLAELGQFLYTDNKCLI